MNVVSNLNNRSPDLDQSIVVNQELNDRRPTRFQPFKKGTVRSVSDSKPDDHRPNGCSCGPFGEVLVFCDDDGIDAKGMIPDHGIFGTGQTDVIDVLGRVSLVRQPLSQSGRQLSIDQEIHYEIMTTA